MIRPPVTVVVLHSGREHFLRTRSVASVLRQTYPHWTLLLAAEPGRMASASRLAAELADPRVRPTPASDVAGWLDGDGIVAPLKDDAEFLPWHLEEAVSGLAGADVDLFCGAVLLWDIETGAEQCLPPPRVEVTEDRLLALTSSSLAFRTPLAVGADLIGLTADAVDRAPALWRTLSRLRVRTVPRPQSVSYGPAGPLRVTIPSLPPAQEVLDDVRDILDRSMLSNDGPWSRRLEGEACAYLGVRHAIPTCSADVALIVTLSAAARLRPRRRRVVLPSYTFPSTANAVRWAGLEPVFCDVELDSLCVSPRTVAAVLDDDTAAVLAVHAHGNPCDMPGLERLVGVGGALLVADAAAAFGATVGGRRVGSFGSAEVFSLSGTKCLTGGEGGLLCCADDDLAALLRRIGHYGIDATYECALVGINAKMAELPAALAVRGLPCIEPWLAARRRAVDRYRELLAPVPGVALQAAAAAEAVSAWKDLAVILSEPRTAGEIAERASAYGVGTRPYYRPLHRMPPFRDCPKGDLSATERIADRVVCLPLYSSIRDEVIDLASAVVRECCD